MRDYNQRSVSEHLDIELSTDLVKDRVGNVMSMSLDGRKIALSGLSKGHVTLCTREENKWTEIARMTPDQPNEVELSPKIALSGNGEVLSILRHRENGHSSYLEIYRIDEGVHKKVSLDLPGLKISTFITSNSSLTISDDGKTIAVGNTSDRSVYIIQDTSILRVIRPHLDLDDRLYNKHRFKSFDDRDMFGSSISLSGNGLYLAVGAPNFLDTSRFTTGRVFVYDLRFEGVKPYSVETERTETNFRFGSHVSFDHTGDSLLISSDQTELRNGLGTVGRVYLFKREKARYYKVHSFVNKDFSSSSLGHNVYGSESVISSDGNTIVIGSPYLKHKKINTDGLLEVYKRKGNLWYDELTLVGEDHLSFLGRSFTLDSTGSLIAFKEELESSKVIEVIKL